MTGPSGHPDGRRVVRLLAIALALSALMSGTVLWILRRPGERPAAAIVVAAD